MDILHMHGRADPRVARPRNKGAGAAMRCSLVVLVLRFGEQARPGGRGYTLLASRRQDIGIGPLRVGVGVGRSPGLRGRRDRASAPITEICSERMRPMRVLDALGWPRGARDRLVARRGVSCRTGRAQLSCAVSVEAKQGAREEQTVTDLRGSAAIVDNGARYIPRRGRAITTSQGVGKIGRQPARGVSTGGFEPGTSEGVEQSGAMSLGSWPYRDNPLGKARLAPAWGQRVCDERGPRAPRMAVSGSRLPTRDLAGLLWVETRAVLQLQAHVERGRSWLGQIGDSRSEILPRHLHCARRPARCLRLPQAHSRDVSGNASPERRNEHQQVPAKLDPAIDGMCSAMSVAVDCSQSTSLSPVRPGLELDHLECAVRRIWAKPRWIELAATDRC
ncbi:hypothetical protein HETIRDRAFT_430013 [Heterobasidion irregulare TC 32-1]|uniref:Uncharacterized protein n=1 Tax=Heterobasidion irregulare (strain TC 32-1) TaxID=747525 RepID=W4JT43_HETIT|nr:uncharacterized protein HETIRDRAFT_430013 [Heterobasidion irregulare TC 32-1]ETW76629.1 hypothetical protein HETIRDRAFT_430013 [Heterobasidion irregulare TC 32-1]